MAKEIKIGSFLAIRDVQVTEMMSLAGFDALTIDLQHGLYNLDTSLAAAQILHDKNVELFARLPWNDPSVIMRLLDMGITTLICPSVSSADQVRSFVSSCYYPPLGERSFGPIRSSKSGKEYINYMQQNVRPIAMIETSGAYKEIEEIASIEGLRGLFIGPYDLSISMRFNRLGDIRFEPMAEVIQNVLQVCNDCNLLSMIFTTKIDEFTLLKNMGFDYVFYHLDSGILNNALADLIPRLR